MFTKFIGGITLSLKKRFITKLAFVTMLSVAGVSAATAVQPHTNTVHASTTSVAARSLGVDVASYQNADLSRCV